MPMGVNMKACPVALVKHKYKHKDNETFPFLAGRCLHVSRENQHENSIFAFSYCFIRANVHYVNYVLKGSVSPVKR
jgi:hypothetical protein